MKKSEIIHRSAKLAAPYCVSKRKKFRLRDFDPADIGNVSPEDKTRAKEWLGEDVETLAELQDVLYAQDRWSVLLIFQAMDAAGKDGAIKHVMSGVNPQGCQVFSFKTPSAEDLNHACGQQMVYPGRRRSCIDRYASLAESPIPPTKLRTAKGTCLGEEGAFERLA